MPDALRAKAQASIAVSSMPVAETASAPVAETASVPVAETASVPVAETAYASAPVDVMRSTRTRQVGKIDAVCAGDPSGVMLPTAPEGRAVAGTSRCSPCRIRDAVEGLACRRVQADHQVGPRNVRPEPRGKRGAPTSAPTSDVSGAAADA